MADTLSRTEEILTSMVNGEQVTTKPLSRVEELLVELADVISGGGGGGGFTPTQSQLTAMNSGIDSAKVAQITTNETNISIIQSEISTLTNPYREIALDWSTHTMYAVDGKIEKRNNRILAPLPSNVAYIETLEAINYFIAAFNQNNYVGVWNGTTFGSTTAVWYQNLKFDVNQIISKYPDYDLWIIAANSEKTEIKRDNPAHSRNHADG